ncbi:MAG TPA: hypothetical protein VIG99_20205 [Myxococcaceae bacterium]|jgi:hypothetical protein
MKPIMAVDAGARGVDPAALGAKAAAPEAADPIDAAIDAFLGDEPAAEDAAAMGAGAPTAGGLPVVAGDNGQAMVVTNQGALPLFMSEQGPMAMTQGGAVPLQSLAQSGAMDSFQAPAQAQPQTREAAVKEAVVKVAQAATEVAATAVKTLAAAISAPAARFLGTNLASRPAPAPTTSAAPYSGQSAFVPARSAPVPTPRAAPVATPRVASNDVFQAMGGGAKPAAAPVQETVTQAKLDPKLHKDAGGGTRLGTNSSGEGGNRF